MKYTPVIGLEIHVELKTQSKMFCGCKADHFGVEPNTQTCPVCLGLPGALPVPNRKAIEWAVRLGLALDCRIAKESKFDRKNYFYPDLPKGYQISQYDEPLCLEGKMTLKSGKEIIIRRVHLEEDTAKLIHEESGGQSCSLIDFNRSGVPLVEVVTEPDFENAEQVDEFLKSLQLIVRYLDISTADMEKGSMRLEPNISVRPEGQKELPSYKVEVKNINSFKFARKAIEYETSRQIEALEKGEKLFQETRGWNEAGNKTVSQREKEEANDYRYFPEPDIPPLSFEDSWVNELKSALGELPGQKAERLVKQYGLSPYQADLLTETKRLADYFEETAGQKLSNPKEIANWLINKKIDITTTSPRSLLEQIAESKEMTSLGDDEMEKTINQVLVENAQAAEDYKKGKTAILGFLIGCTVKKMSRPSGASKGASQADRQAITEKLQEKLK